MLSNQRRTGRPADAELRAPFADLCEQFREASGAPPDAHTGLLRGCALFPHRTAFYGERANVYNPSPVGSLAGRGGGCLGAGTVCRKNRGVRMPRRSMFWKKARNRPRV